MDTAALDYELPASAIAQVPAEPRDAARLLVDAGPDVAVAHRHVRELPDLLAPGDLLVVNDSRVIPARLRLRKASGGAVEVLLLDRRPEGHWEALVRPSRRVPPGSVLTPDAPERPELGVTVEVGEVLGPDGRRAVVIRGPEQDGGRGPAGEAGDLAAIGAVGEMPLPPYIHEPLADPARYQTVYANQPGSVAAPTAGLHLTDGVLGRCVHRGVSIVAVDLRVGLGTFRPITAERVEDHAVHAERYRIPPETVAALEAQRARGGSVVAVGTTVVRALESWAVTGMAEAETTLFIHGSHRFAVVDRLLTNFHVPRSSLLALVQAFVGPRWRDLYSEARAEGYRFLSFGDAMLLDRVAP